jgi:hypothetical protein
MGKSPRLALVLICMVSIFLSSCGTGDESTVGRGNLWTWKGGANTITQPGLYGATTGTSGMPGARFNAVSWTNSVNGLWLFGGQGYDKDGNFGYLNDLWISDGTNWTWESGSSTINHQGIYTNADPTKNVPGSRSGAISWIDASNNLWLFGGQGYDSAGNFGYLNDLWMFDTIALMWTWKSGSDTRNQTGVYSGTPVPGARSGAISMMDVSGNLQFFGGEGYASTNTVGKLSDLGKFDVVALTWTWVGGWNVVDQPGTYSGPTPIPGARSGAVSWVDSGGNLWLFGGNGYDSLGALGELNDLWELAGGIWTWKSGSSIVDQPGTYGTLGTPDAGNMPGARDGAVSWIDLGGNLWLFGGQGFDKDNPITLPAGYLNDLWRYDGTNWTWIKGSDTKNQSGIYGDHMGLPLDSTVPGGRSGSVKGILNGNLFLFGGFGYDITTIPGYLNDVWRYQQ